MGKQPRTQKAGPSTKSITGAPLTQQVSKTAKKQEYHLANVQMVGAAAPISAQPRQTMHLTQSPKIIYPHTSQANLTDQLKADQRQLEMKRASAQRFLSQVPHMAPMVKGIARVAEMNMHGRTHVAANNAPQRTSKQQAYGTERRSKEKLVTVQRFKVLSRARNEK
jgi:hypothetical protein